MSEMACCDTTPAFQQYKRKIRISITAYTVTLLLAITFLRAFPESAWKIPVMLVPVIPAIWGVVAALQFVRAMDELQRRVHLEGVSFAFTVTVLITLTWGLMERAGLPHLPSVWVASMSIASSGAWGITLRLEGIDSEESRAGRYGQNASGRKRS